MRVFIDFETASDVDVTVVGAYRYATDPSTKIRLMCWKVVASDGIPLANGTWRPDMAEWNHQVLAVALKFGEVWAHNATFERLIMEHVVPGNLPKPSFNQWRCTAALARSCGLPGSLADAARALRLPVKKADNTIMKRARDPRYHLALDEWLQLEDYCKTDVDVCAEIWKCLGDFADSELVVYQVNEHVNDRGVAVDMGLALKMNLSLAPTFERLDKELAEVTRGLVTAATQVQRLKKWVEMILNVHLGSLDKDAITQLLKRDLPPEVRRALEIRAALAKSSTAKYGAILNQTDADARLRGMFLFAGAGQTGRFSSKGAQLHNLPRAVPADAGEIIEWVKRSDCQAPDLVYGDQWIDMASQLIRPCFVAPPGKVFCIADYSGIEARGLPWLAKAEHALAPFREGRDPYLSDAAAVFNVKPEDVNGDQRQVGKVVRLACGFGGDYGALLAMARGYKLDLSEDEAKRIAGAWHEANPWARAFGRSLYDTALEVLNSRMGTVKQVPGAQSVWYGRHSINGIEVLLCCLPSGRVLHYHDVRLDGTVIQSRRPRFKNHEDLWYGLFSENVTQASMNDVMRHGMVMLHYSNYPIVAHVHDEFVIELDVDADAADDIQRLLETPPSWCADFPLEAKPKLSTRYGK